jgi:hypothetical protein
VNIFANIGYVENKQTFVNHDSNVYLDEFHQVRRQNEETTPPLEYFALQEHIFR